MNIPDEGCLIHLKGYGQIERFKVQYIEKKPEFWATDMLSMNPERRAELRKFSWKIDKLHRGVKLFLELNAVRQEKVSLHSAIFSSQFAHSWYLKEHV